MSKIPDSINFAVPRRQLNTFALEQEPNKNFMDLASVSERFQASDASSGVIVEKRYPALSPQTIDRAHKTYEAGSKRCQVATGLMAQAAGLGLLAGSLVAGVAFAGALVAGVQSPLVQGATAALAGGATAVLVAQKGKFEVDEEKPEDLKAMGPYLDHGQGQFHQFLDAYKYGKVQQHQAQMMVNPPPTVLATYQAGQGPEGLVVGERKPR